MKYNSLGFLGFSVDHVTEDPYRSVSADDIRKAIIKRLANCTDDQLLDEISLDDTYKNSEVYDDISKKN